MRAKNFPRTAAIAALGVAAVSVSLLIVGDGGPLETRNLNLADFEALSISHGIQTDVVFSAEYAGVLTGRARDLDDTMINVSDNALDVSRSTNFASLARNLVRRLLGQEEPLRLSISVPRLTSMTARLGGIVTVPEIDAERLSIVGETGARFIISGTVDALRVDAQSGSIVEAPDLTTQMAEINAASGAKVVVRITDAVQVRSLAGANVRVLGNPAQRDEDASSGGMINIEK